MKHFIIAAGGTGMRLLESFVHQCAAGVYPGLEFDILSIDTDSENKNRQDLKALTEWYAQIRGKTDPQSSRLFSAKINAHHFVTRMPQNNSNNIENILQNIPTSNREENQLLAKALLSKNVREFNLDHGYRAQTQLGSLHMFATILNSARNISNNEADENENILKAYIQSLQNSATDSKIMVMGSVFGGTGASSVPIIPKALNEAGKIIIGPTFTISDRSFGCAVMTDYFTFNPPLAAQEQTEKIVAKAFRFRDNSQLALDYYSTQMGETYKNIYLVGNNGLETKADYSNKNGAMTITGGRDQDNPSHYLELATAASVYHFLNANNTTTEYYYKTLEIGNSQEELNFDTIIYNCKNNLLEKGFANLLALEITRRTYSGKISNFLERNQKIQLEQVDSEILDKYLERFQKFYEGLEDSSNCPNTNLLNSESLKTLNLGIVYKDKKNHIEKGSIFGNYINQVNDKILVAEYSLDTENQLDNNTHRIVNMFYNTFNQLTKIN